MARGGKREGSGRKKGVPNKINADLKGMILTALENKGGASYLEVQAEKNPAAFLSLIGKVLPMTVVGDPDQPLTIRLVSGVTRADDSDAPEHVDGSANGHSPSH